MTTARGTGGACRRQDEIGGLGIAEGPATMNKFSYGVDTQNALVFFPELDTGK
jgi:hypothetical protein